MAAKNFISIATGSFGDIINMLSVSEELAARGCQVDFVADRKYRELAQTKGMNFVDPGLPESLLENNVTDVWRSSPPSARSFQNFYGEQQEQINSFAKQVCEKYDAVLLNGNMRMAAHTLDSLAMPTVVLLSEIIPLSEDQFRVMNDSWQDRRGPLVVATYDKAFYDSRIPANFSFAGFFCYDDESHEGIGDDTADVVVTLGSMQLADIGQKLKSIDSALGDLGLSGLLINSKGPFANEFDNLRCIERTPFSNLFPNVKAVIHHGAVGTIGHALASKKPSCVIPSLPLQRKWGEALASHGFATMVDHDLDQLAENLTAALDLDLVAGTDDVQMNGAKNTATSILSNYG